MIKIILFTIVNKILSTVPSSPLTFHFALRKFSEHTMGFWKDHRKCVLSKIVLGLKKLPKYTSLFIPFFHELPKVAFYLLTSANGISKKKTLDRYAFNKYSMAIKSCLTENFLYCKILGFKMHQSTFVHLVLSRLRHSDWDSMQVHCLPALY